MVHRVLREDGTYLTEIANFSWSEQVNAAQDLQFGSAVSSTIRFKVYGTQSAAIEKGEKLVYSQTGSEGDETIIGTFFADPSIPNKHSYTVIAYDAIGMLEKDFSARLVELQSVFPMDVRTLVTFACEYAGVELAPSTEWQFSDYMVEAFTLDGVTCRQILSWAAEMGGRYLTCDIDGRIEFSWYSTNNSYLLTYGSGETGGIPHAYYKQNGLNYENYETADIDAVSVILAIGADSNIEYRYPANPSGNNILYVKDNYLINTADERAEEIAQYLYGIASAFPSYRPMTAKVFPFANPFRAGEIVSVTDIQGVSFTAPIMKLTVTDSYALLESFGHETLPTADSYLQQSIQYAVKRIESRIRNTINTEIAGVVADTETLVEQTESQIMSSVSETYYSKDETDEAIGIASTTATQTANSYTLDFVNSLQSQISSNKASADGEFETLHKYIIAEGGTLTFKTDDSVVSLVVENDRIGIYENGTLVTYWTNTEQVAPSSFSIPVGGRFTLGNFAYIPRSNGNLDFSWIGD